MSIDYEPTNRLLNRSLNKSYRVIVIKDIMICVGTVLVDPRI